MVFLRDQTLQARKPACRVSLSGMPRSRSLSSLGGVSSKRIFPTDNLGARHWSGSRRHASISVERFRAMLSQADCRSSAPGRALQCHRQSTLSYATCCRTPCARDLSLRLLASIDVRAIRAAVGRTTGAQENSVASKSGSLARRPLSDTSVRYAKVMRMRPRRSAPW